MVVKALLLVGGKSTRMGTDKYLLNINGAPQYEHLYNVLDAIGLEVFLSVSIEQSRKIPPQYTTIVDRYSEVGPMGGLISALYQDARCSWLTVACDLIHLDARGVRDLVEGNEEIYDVVTYQKEGSPFVETTLTIYNPGSYILLKRALRNREFSLQHILKKSAVKTLRPYESRILDNVNEPEDLK